jgi:hypothetical protein
LFLLVYYESIVGIYTNLKIIYIMKNLVFALFILVSGFALAQGKFEQAMGKAMQLWEESKVTEASALFERIALAEKASWLPNYYVATVNCFEAFSTKDKTQIEPLLAKAQKALDVELIKAPNNEELIVMQAMIHTALLSSDPMKYGMTLPSIIAELYEKAEAIAPNNPRVVYGKAEFAIGGAKWTGANVKVLCKDVERSIGLFATFKPNNAFSPNWGLDRAENALKGCK